MFDMHSYLIIGKDTFEKEVELTQKLHGTNFEFSISKIEEVRELTNFLRTTQPPGTIIVAHNIDSATHEALNAFLKSLEEPQKNVSFILTAKNEYQVLPTIISRCQVIRVSSGKWDVRNKEPDEFINATTGKKLEIIDKIKGRPEAVEFVQNLLEMLHTQLNKNKNTDYLQTALQLQKTQDALNALQANGNISLQLTNLIVNLDAGQKPLN